MRKTFNTLSICFLFFNSAISQSSQVELKQATNHPMQYYISLPVNWDSHKIWPVVIAFEEAEKQFKKNTELFANARKDLPFIIIVPIITTNGNYGYRDPGIYPYSSSIWDTIDKVSTCNFDIQGLQNIIKEVREKYSGSEKVFITGFEAGAHLLWTILFQHPEWIYVAAPVEGNFRNRCLENNSFSKDEYRTKVLINNFIGAEDEFFGAKGNLYSQYLEAKKLALKHGYKNISETIIKNKGHEPLPGNVIDYFYTVWKKNDKNN